MGSGVFGSSTVTTDGVTITSTSGVISIKNGGVDVSQLNAAAGIPILLETNEYTGSGNLDLTHTDGTKYDFYLIRGRIKMTGSGSQTLFMRIDGKAATTKGINNVTVTIDSSDAGGVYFANFSGQGDIIFEVCVAAHRDSNNAIGVIGNLAPYGLTGMSGSFNANSEGHAADTGTIRFYWAGGTSPTFVTGTQVKLFGVQLKS